jgi:transposase
VFPTFGWFLLFALLAGMIRGIPWQLLPVAQLGCGSPVTCWRRLRDWQRVRVWQQLHHLLLEELGRQGQLGAFDAWVAVVTGGHATVRQGRPATSMWRCEPLPAQRWVEGGASAPGWTGGRPNLAARSGPPPKTKMRAMPVWVTVRTPSPNARWIPSLSRW